MFNFLFNRLNYKSHCVAITRAPARRPHATGILTPQLMFYIYIYIYKTQIGGVVHGASGENQIRMEHHFRLADQMAEALDCPFVLPEFHLKRICDDLSSLLM